MRLIKFLIKFTIYFVLITVAWVGLYGIIPPPITATMIMDDNSISKDWTAFEDISPNMARAVIAAAGLFALSVLSGYPAPTFASRSAP